MSLKLLFTLMGLVTALMIGGVVYTKILTPPAERPLSVGEMRSIDRVCDTHCGMQIRAMADDAQDEAALEVRIQACLQECRVRLTRDRLPANDVRTEERARAVEAMKGEGPPSATPN